jgi:hypothetical protein
LAYPQLVSHTQPETPPQSSVEPLAKATDDWASVEEDLDLVRNTRANLLVIGPESLVMDVVRWVIADVPASIIIGAGEAGRLRLSHLSLRGSILVLRDLDELDAEGQASLYEWLDGTHGEHQIVCTASPLLLSMLKTGEFDGRLYYRLNTICIRLTDS